jgi:hypothetical protein
MYSSIFRCLLCQDDQPVIYATNSSCKDVFLICTKESCRAAFSFSTHMNYLRNIIRNVQPDYCFKVNAKHTRDDSPISDIDYRLTRGPTRLNSESEEDSLSRSDATSTASETFSLEMPLPTPSLQQSSLDWQSRFENVQRENLALKLLNEKLTNDLSMKDAKIAALEVSSQRLEERLSVLESKILPVEDNASQAPAAPLQFHTKKASTRSGSPSFADVVTQGPSPKPAEPKPPRDESKQVKKLSPEELSRVLLGLSPKPPRVRNINAVFATGIRAQKIRSLKTILKEQCNVALRNILSIDFIGRSVTEFHIFSDYIPEFKNLMKMNCPTIEFLDLDPLDTALLKNVAAEERAGRAVALYTKRLTRRLKTSPSKAHQHFLRGELDRIGAPTEQELPSTSMETSL